MTLAARIRNAGVIYLEHADWGASVSRWRGPGGGAMVVQSRPASKWWVHHSVTLADDDHDLLATDDVIRDMKELEDIGISRFGRPSYPFAIHPSGVIGQLCYPWIGAHTAGYNSSTLAGVHIGNFENDQPTDAALRSNAVLIAALQADGALVNDSPIDGHRNANGASTACPGRNLYAQIPRIASMVPEALTPAPPAFHATTAQGGPMVTLFHPSSGRCDDFWIADDKSVWHSFFLPSVGWSTPESLGGQAQSVSATWRFDGGQLRVLVLGVPGGRWEKIWDGSTWIEWRPVG